MENQNGVIWYDGTLVPWREATTHVLTHSLHYGVAVFEGVRGYVTPAGPALFRLGEHTDRLLGSAHVYGMRLPYSRDALMAAQLAVVGENGLGRCYVRTIAFYGPEKLGVNPRGALVHVASAAFPWESYLGADAKQRGSRVKTAAYRRPSANAALPRAKVSGFYANSVLANQEATADGYDEALLLDNEGFVAEGSGENLFLVENGVLVEPELSSALHGITRDSVVTLAREHGYEVRTRRLTRDDIYRADEAFFTGTAAEVSPVVELDRRAIGDGRPGPVTRTLMTAFEAATAGADSRHEHWLHPIRGATSLAS